MLIRTRKYGEIEMDRLDDGFLHWIINQGKYPQHIKDEAARILATRSNQPASKPPVSYPYGPKYSAYNGNEQTLRCRIIFTACHALSAGCYLDLLTAVNKIENYVLYGNKDALSSTTKKEESHAPVKKEDPLASSDFSEFEGEIYKNNPFTENE